VRRAAIAALLGAATIAGCGGIKAPDLFLVERTSAGAPPLMLLVNEEGGVRCNGGPGLKLGDPQLVEARAIQEALREPSSKHLTLAPRPGSVFSYRVRDENGGVSFGDNSSGQPQVLRRLALFVLQTAQRVCHLSQ
jgi:hypothetical protein